MNDDDLRSFHYFFRLEWDSYRLERLSEFIRIAKQDLDSVVGMVKDSETATFESHQRAYDRLREIGDRISRNADHIWSVQESESEDSDDDEGTDFY